MIIRFCILLLLFFPTAGFATTTVATPTAAPVAGSYANAQSVVLSDTTPGATIYYTTDGTTPTCSSTAYASPLSVSLTTQLSYIACATGDTNSAVATSNYVIAAGTLGGMSVGPLGDLHGWIPSPNDAWHQPINNMSVDPNSATIINNIGETHLHHDFSSFGYGIPYTVVDSTTTPLVPWTTESAVSGTDQNDVALYPLPPGMLIEGAPTNCGGLTGDNHAIVIDRHTGVGYEMWLTQYCPSNPMPYPYSAADGTIWDFTETEARPYGFTSADAAGLSVFEGLIRYDEILAGVIPHAIRFTVPFARCDNYRDGDCYGAFELPATHSAGNNGGTLNIYGMRIRLQAGYTNPACTSTTDQIIITAMQTYGMMMADLGSSLYFQGTPDPRWDDNDLVSCLDSIPNTAFDVVQQGTVYASDRYPSASPPTINSFTASANTIHAGDSVTLTADTSGASYNFIDQAGFLRGNSITVQPTQTTTYVLTSTNFNLANDDGFSDGNRPTASVTVTVLPAQTTAPTLIFASIQDQTFGTAPFTVSATSNSSGAITYSVVSGPATISGNTVTLTGVGSVQLQASQAASGNYGTGTATASFNVVQKTIVSISSPTTEDAGSTANIFQVQTNAGQSTIYDFKPSSGGDQIQFVNPASTTSIISATKYAVLWFSGSNAPVEWQMNGQAVQASAVVGVANPGYTAAALGDFDGDGNSDVLWTPNNGHGNPLIWFMKNTTALSAAFLPYASVSSKVWTGDFNGDGNADILWDLGSGSPVIWEMNGTNVIAAGVVGLPLPGYHISGTGNFNGNGISDILWVPNTVNQFPVVWMVNGLNATGIVLPYPAPSIKAWVGDFNGDGNADILWDMGSAAPILWEMSGSTVISSGPVGFGVPGYHIASVGDFDGNGTADILWAPPTPNLFSVMWFMNGFTATPAIVPYRVPSTEAFAGRFHNTTLVSNGNSSVLLDGVYQSLLNSNNVQ